MDNDNGDPIAEEYPLAPRCYRCARRHRGDLPCWTGPYAQRLVKDTLKNRGRMCWLCGKDGATSCDHRIPRSRSGGDELENRFPAHTTCNSERGNDPAPGLAARLVVVTGPPAAGKTTYVAERAKPGDVVVDLDALAAAMTPGLTDVHDYPVHILRVAQAARAAAIRAIYRLYAGPTAYVIHTNPSEAQRAAYLAHGAEFVHIDPGLAVTRSRAVADGRPPQTLAYLADYYVTGGAAPHTTDAYTPPAVSARWRPLAPPPAPTT